MDIQQMIFYSDLKNSNLQYPITEMLPQTYN